MSEFETIEYKLKNIVNKRRLLNQNTIRVTSPKLIKKSTSPKQILKHPTIKTSIGISDGKSFELNGMDNSNTNLISNLDEQNSKKLKKYFKF